MPLLLHFYRYTLHIWYTCASQQAACYEWRHDRVKITDHGPRLKIQNISTNYNVGHNFTAIIETLQIWFACASYGAAQIDMAHVKVNVTIQDQR